ncbi:type II secretion system GspH family protein [Patescibacteria group bacterium]|nr:type II secretion system GspH family protein [Patescibacteria group bacterium]MBU1755176.1 type II secretion system GspH family protein [Patescibacteria group bacterium]
MKPRGFTLIELLVVIAIIGILSAVVLASLNTARENSRAAAIKAQTREFRNIMELEYTDTGSYVNLNRGWAKAGQCASRGYAGAYASKAVEICESLGGLVTNPNVNGHMHTGVNTGIGFSNSNNYSIMTRLPSGAYFCLGSGGGSSDTTVGAWTESGCYSNP